MASERMNLRIRIPMIYCCMTDGCTELTRVSYCEACFKDILKPIPKKPKSEEKPSEQNTLSKGLVSIERRYPSYNLSG